MKLLLTSHPNLGGLYESLASCHPLDSSLSALFFVFFFYSESLDPELVAAVSAAASTLPNHSQAESELLKQLRQHEAVTEAQKKGDMNNLGYVSSI